MEILENEPLSRHTTYHVGGPARYFIRSTNEKDLVEALQFAKSNKLPFFILGNGSNTLFPDEGFPGVVIHMEDRTITSKGDTVSVGCGVFMRQLVNSALENGLTGLENLAGIPGTVGGAVRGNAGTWHTEVKDVLQNVLVIDADNPDKETQIFKPADCRFGYRDSIFKHQKNLVITRASFKCLRGDIDKSRQLIEEDRQNRHERQPYDYPSAGSVFKNPDPEHGIYSGALIEQAGLKGYSVGGAMVSDKHANFIVNVNKASSSDILQIISTVQESVEKKFSIKLEPEIQIVRI